MKMLLESLHGVVPSILLCSGLGSLPWKHFATETSKNVELCREAVLHVANLRKYDHVSAFYHTQIELVATALFYSV